MKTRIRNLVLASSLAIEKARSLQGVKDLTFENLRFQGKATGLLRW